MFFFYNEKVKLEKEKANESKTQVLILNSNFFWKYKNKEWSKISLNSELNLINWKKFDIYMDNEFYNTYKYVFTNGKGYFYNEDNESIDLNSNYVLINKDSFISILTYNEVSFDTADSEIVSSFLELNGKNYNDIFIKRKYIISEDSCVYVVSNYYDDIDYDDVYSMVFYRKGKKNYLVNTGNHLYDLHVVLDINKKFPNIVLSYDTAHVKFYEMFQFNHDKYINVTDF